MCTEQNPDPGVIQSPAEGQTEPTVATPAPPTEPVSSLKELDWTPTKLPNFWGRLLGFTSWSVISGFMTAVC
ncbi:MAG: hypothetical protein NTU97_00140, partial [Candidatus Magasanikbacteria bacterium]|nr:hypothetical protein [Candidatus Magasanikbacteria bacterium]